MKDEENETRWKNPQRLPVAKGRKAGTYLRKVTVKFQAFVWKCVADTKSQSEWTIFP